MWVFAYGSLMWRPDFPYRDRELAALEGYRRCFWQASPDHRGTPERPGRVVTLVRDAGARCEGLAFDVSRADASRVLAELDVREIGGYRRERIRLSLADGRRVSALTYIAHPDNPHFLGAAGRDSMLAQIRSAHGESGPNSEYVLRLANELGRLGICEPHTQELAEALRHLT